MPYFQLVLLLYSVTKSLQTQTFVLDTKQIYVNILNPIYKRFKHSEPEPNFYLVTFLNPRLKSLQFLNKKLNSYKTINIKN